ncbi:MAG: hypothetical protein D6715_04560 [Calditrichaeota bacterium]|nr:MAG: hypothetical protein D6715_04560 [Calditrichota bacterium]
MQKSIRSWIVLTPLVLLLFFNGRVVDPVGKITFPLNRVFVIRPGQDRPLMATFNMDVYPGDKVETKKESRCEITFLNGHVVRLDENSIYTLEQVEISEKRTRVESGLSLGRLWSNIRKIFSKEDYFRVKSPTAVVAVRGTIYRVNANPDSSTEVYVYQGEVAVSPAKAGPGQPQGGGGGPKRLQKPSQVAPPTQVQGPTEVSLETWFEIVKAQQQIIVRPDGSYQKASFDPAKDATLDWVQWNKERDALLQR